MSKMDEYRSKCNCPPCPTYLECAKEKDELAFCMSKRSSCIKEMKCAFALVASPWDLDLQFMYYCIRGNESEQEHKRRVRPPSRRGDVHGTYRWLVGVPGLQIELVSTGLHKPTTWRRSRDRGGTMTIRCST